MTTHTDTRGGIAIVEIPDGPNAGRFEVLDFETEHMGIFTTYAEADRFRGVVAVGRQAR